MKSTNNQAKKSILLKNASNFVSGSKTKSMSNLSKLSKKMELLSMQLLTLLLIHTLPKPGNNPRLFLFA